MAVKKKIVPAPPKRAWDIYAEAFEVKDLTAEEEARTMRVIEDIYELGVHAGRALGFVEAGVQGIRSDAVRSDQ